MKEHRQSATAPEPIKVPGPVSVTGLNPEHQDRLQALYDATTNVPTNVPVDPDFDTPEFQHGLLRGLQFCKALALEISAQVPSFDPSLFLTILRNAEDPKVALKLPRILNTDPNVHTRLVARALIK